MRKEEFKMLQQKNGWGCGVYAVANALGMEDFVSEERLEASRENGNNLMQLNKWLLDDGVKYQIMPLYYRNGVQFRTPKTGLYFDANDNFLYYPVLVTLHVPRCPKNHMIAIRFYYDMTITVLDSCEPIPQNYLLWEDVRGLYRNIISLNGFMSFTGENVYFEKIT